MKVLTTVILASVAVAAHAQIYWDQGPGTGTIWDGNIENVYNTQNLVDSVIFAQDTVVNRFVTYNTEPTNGPDYLFRVFADVNGHPGGDSLYFGAVGSTHTRLIGHDSLNNTPIYEHTLDFPINPFTFLANTTYWVGAPTNAPDTFGTATTIRSPYDGRCAIMNGTSFDHFYSDQQSGGGDLMFQLGAVPEPASLVVLGIGIVAALRLRRKR